MTGTKVEAIHHHGVTLYGRALVVGTRCSPPSNTRTPTA